MREDNEKTRKSKAVTVYMMARMRVRQLRKRMAVIQTELHTAEDAMRDAADAADIDSIDLI